MSSVRASLNAVRVVVIIGGCSLAAVLTVGCSTPQTAPDEVAATDDPLAAVPDDLTLDLRVLRPQSTSAVRRAESTDTPVRAARFVLMPDGTLHGELDGSHHERDLPPEIRRLQRRQLAEVWALLSELGFTSPQTAEPLLNPLLINRPDSGVLYVLSVRGHERWWQIRRQPADADGDDPAMARLAAHLSNLAWLNDARDRAARIAPRRYDFGPDPYAQYRDHD